MFKEKVEASVGEFVEWLEDYGDKSYDRMDFWSSTPGLFVKKLFYKNKLLGFPLAGLAQLVHTVFPAALKLFAEPRREAIGDAHYAMAFLNLYEQYGEDRYLDRTESFLEALKDSAVEGYSGMCWGYTYDWQQPYGRWPAGTPLVTITPYPFWAFKQHYEATGSEESLEICRSAADFALEDLNKMEMPDGTVCTSYSPLDNSRIVNANTYRAALLLDAYAMTGREHDRMKDEAALNIEFVLSRQCEDGSWTYEARDKQETFIDNFHTCFVLRNLYKCYAVTGDKEILDAVNRGYDYYRKYLIREDNTPIHFSHSKYPKLRKYEMYDYAEGIKLGCYLKEEIDGSFEFSNVLADTLIDRFQLDEGYFVTRVTQFGLKHKIPYHRWPQSQLFCALTQLLKQLS